MFLDFLRNRKATAAIEFALLGPVFIAMCCALLTVAWTWLASIDVQRAVEVAARKVMLGEVSPSVDGFGRSVCRESIFNSCSSLSFEVLRFGEIVAVRAVYKPLFPTFMHPVSSTVAIRLESDVCGGMLACVAG